MSLWLLLVERQICDKTNSKIAPGIHSYSSRIDLATYLMKLASSQIDCADNSYIAVFPFIVLSCDLVVFVCFRFCSLCFVASWLQSEIIITMENNPLLYYGVIANSDQSFHYYRILSRVVG